MVSYTNGHQMAAIISKHPQNKFRSLNSFPPHLQPPESNFFHIRVAFGKNYAKQQVSTPLGLVPTGKSWIRHWLGLMENFSEKRSCGQLEFKFLAPTGQLL